MGQAVTARLRSRYRIGALGAPRKPPVPTISLDPFASSTETSTPEQETVAPTTLLKEAEQTLRAGATESHRAHAIKAHQHAPWPGKMESLCWFLRPHEGA